MPTVPHQRGFIALLSVIIISAVLLVLVIAIGGTSILSRVNILNYQYKEASSSLADGCVDVAMLKLINDATYNPSNEVVSLGTNSCTIVSVTTSGGQKIIKTKGIYPASGSSRSYTNLQTTVTLSSGAITVNSWEEVAHF